jgi:hypothetical protein
LKTFCAEIINDHKALELEHGSNQDLPVISTIHRQIILDNYLHIKKDIQEVLSTEINRMINSPELASLIIKRD